MKVAHAFACGKNVVPVNRIGDLTPLAGLANLTLLGLDQNQITDGSPVEHVSNILRQKLAPYLAESTSVHKQRK